MTKYKPRACSLFDGVGGMDTAFGQTEFEIIWVNEIDKDARKTYLHNFPNTVLSEGDIKNINAFDIPDFDVLATGPPCQSFLVCGNKKDLPMSAVICFLK